MSRGLPMTLRAKQTCPELVLGMLAPCAPQASTGPVHWLDGRGLRHRSWRSNLDVENGDRKPVTSSGFIGRSRRRVFAFADRFAAAGRDASVPGRARRGVVTRGWCRTRRRAEAKDEAAGSAQ